ncbi:leukocyte receptor cluster member 1 [Drosophila guanche]|uniref:Blast:Leukocyte receptor cluster member 1 n=1 Tax=Drosophila guanche TaxID=7266 RepID=A0A3B0K066_DROGU|nr:leukocyte receptor cluster member 1 [Drosophila guanche]SPP87694.1 blast:Leukocyte receptor cluster member 1 [Drosophila guanche]
MNILPKKRWHVRTKDNIARVRRDEAAAEAENRKRQEKLELAESEARINFLRRQSGLPEKATVPARAEDAAEASPTSGTEIESRCVDLFADYKTHVKTTNKDLEKEQKEEQEKYEKQIGYLTYLGQDTNEALKTHSWYEVAPKRPEAGDLNAIETHLQQKLSHDPLTLINALLPPEKKVPKSVCKRKLTPSPEPSVAEPSPTYSAHKSKKHKKGHKKSSKKCKHSKKGKESDEISLVAARHKREKLELLRKERLRREAVERQRSEALFAPQEAAVPVPASAASKPAATPKVVQKYNSQFNPELAKQNMPSM